MFTCLHVVVVVLLHACMHVCMQTGFVLGSNLLEVVAFACMQMCIELLDSNQRLSVVPMRNDLKTGPKSSISWQNEVS